MQSRTSPFRPRALEINHVVCSLLLVCTDGRHESARLAIDLGHCASEAGHKLRPRLHMGRHVLRKRAPKKLPHSLNGVQVGAAFREVGLQLEACIGDSMLGIFGPEAPLVVLYQHWLANKTPPKAFPQPFRKVPMVKT